MQGPQDDIEIAPAEPGVSRARATAFAIIGVMCALIVLGLAMAHT